MEREVKFFELVIYNQVEQEYRTLTVCKDCEKFVSDMIQDIEDLYLVEKTPLYNPMHYCVICP